MKRFVPENRLRRLIGAPGGIAVEAAVQRAEQQVETLRKDAAEIMREKVRLIDRIATAVNEGGRDDVYRTANDMLGEAGVFGWHELSEAARSLCELLSDRKIQLTSRAVMLHIQTLKALTTRELSGDVPARKAVLEGLRLLSRR